MKTPKTLCLLVAGLTGLASFSALAQDPAPAAAAPAAAAPAAAPAASPAAGDTSMPKHKHHRKHHHKHHHHMKSTSAKPESAAQKPAAEVTPTPAAH